MVVVKSINSSQKSDVNTPKTTLTFEDLLKHAQKMQEQANDQRTFQISKLESIQENFKVTNSEKHTKD